MKKNKLVVSGWPGAGTTTLALLLAYTLDIQLIKGGSAFRYLGSQINFEDTGDDRINADTLLEKHFGPVFDKYVDYKLINSDNLVLESDIAAFRLGKRPEFFSIFLVTDNDVRKKRLDTDKRQKDIELLEKRTQELTKQYKELHNIDWLDLNKIEETYNLVIDNTDTTIVKELELVYNALILNTLDFNKNLKDLTNHTKLTEDLFWQKGKDWIQSELGSKNLLLADKELIIDIGKFFPEEVNKLPDKLKNLF